MSILFSLPLSPGLKKWFFSKETGFNHALNSQNIGEKEKKKKAIPSDYFNHEVPKTPDISFCIGFQVNELELFRSTGLREIDSFLFVRGGEPEVRIGELSGLIPLDFEDYIGGL